MESAGATPGRVAGVAFGSAIRRIVSVTVLSGPPGGIGPQKLRKGSVEVTSVFFVSGQGRTGSLPPLLESLGRGQMIEA